MAVEIRRMAAGSDLNSETAVYRPRRPRTM